MRKNILLIIIIIVIPTISFSQNRNQYSLVLGNEKVAIFDTKEFFTSLNPYIEFNFKMPLKSKTIIYHNFKTFCFYHKNLQTSIGVGYNIEPKFYISKFFIRVQTGFNYMLNYSYLNNFSSVDYTKKSNFENKLTFNIDFLIGYKFRKFELFVKSTNLVEFPFLKNNSFVLPHQILSTGINIEL